LDYSHLNIQGYAVGAEGLPEGIESLPESIGEAIAETERSTIVRQALGNHVFDHLIELKKKEWDDYRTHLSQYEIDRYLPIL
jgi:glutamine synthetase